MRETWGEHEEHLGTRGEPEKNLRLLTWGEPIRRGEPDENLEGDNSSREEHEENQEPEKN